MISKESTAGHYKEPVVIRSYRNSESVPLAAAKNIGRIGHKGERGSQASIIMLKGNNSEANRVQSN